MPEAEGWLVAVLESWRAVNGAASGGKVEGIVPHPELSWWAIRSQLVTDPGHMINSGLGALITAKIRAKTTAAIRSIDAGNARWYAWISANLLRFGGDPDTPKLLCRFLGQAVTPVALTADIALIGAAPASH